MLKLKLILWFILLGPSLLLAQTWQAQSGDKQVAVLELFTAEGCGLCPPADRWVERLPEQGISDDQLIVLGFHIDYLNDKKGWVDRFSSPVFSGRQRQLGRLNLYQTVYTPEFIVSGEIIHNWKKHVKEVVKAVNGFAPEATISLTVNKGKQQLNLQSQIKVKGQENRKYAKLYFAIIEDNITSKVTGGDNAGTTFHHQHLVRKWVGPFDLNDNGESNISTEIAIDPQWDLSQTSIVAEVQNLNDGFVLQGLALPLK